MVSIAQEFEKIVGATGICVWQSLPLWQQANIVQALSVGTQVECRVSPHSPAELAEVIACARQHQWRMLPSGSGSKLSWGGLAPGIHGVLSTERLNRLVEHAVGDLTVTAEAGMKFADLQKTLAAAGQFLALDPAYPEAATLGGIVATADSGSLRQRYGGVRDMLLGVTVVRADGQVAKAGGRVVKNVAGYDLMKLFTGSYGTLGVLTQMTFRVYPLPEASQTVVFWGEVKAIAQATQALLASTLTPISIDALSAQGVADLGLGQGLGLVVRFQGFSASVEQQVSRCLALADLVSVRFSDADEVAFWQTLPTLLWLSDDQAVVCKIGILPSQVVAVLAQLETLAAPSSLALVHVGSGLGLLRLNQAALEPPVVLAVRALCESTGGFLSVLTAPKAFKQQFEVWGYTGSGLEIMRRIKQQFDPDQLLSPQRFVSSI